MGVMKSTDNGETWNTTGLNYNSFYPSVNNTFVIGGMVQNRNNPENLYALVDFELNKGAKIMKTINGGVNWEDQTLPISLNDKRNPDFRKIEMHPTDTSTLYVSGNRVLKTINGGTSWTDITPSLMDTSTYQIERACTAINPFNPNKVLVVMRKYLKTEPTIFVLNLYLSTNGGQTFDSIMPSDSLSEYMNRFKMELEWSKVDPNVFYMGHICVEKFRLLANNEVVNESEYNPGDPPHDDVRDLKTYKRVSITESGERIIEELIFQGNDGGITKGIDKEIFMEWEDISKEGLNITQYYGIGIPSDGSSLIIGGTQDGNLMRYQDGSWTNPKSSDAAEVVFNYRNPDIVYMVTFCFSPYLATSKDKGLSWGRLDIGEPGKNRRNDAPLEMSKTDPNVLFAGGKNIWRSKMSGGVLVFDSISTFPPNPNSFKTIRVADNNNFIIAGRGNDSWDPTRLNRLYKTTNGGYQWDDISPLSDSINFSKAGIFDIALDPESFNTFYVALDGDWEGHKVFKGVGAGTIKWTNMSIGLPNLPVNCLEIYKGSSFNEIFAGTDCGVYYWNDSINSWRPFGTGMPICPVSDLEIDYINHILYASTFGRGIYKADLCSVNVVEANIEINGTEVWEGYKRIPSNVFILPGGNLTIKGEVVMNNDKQIVVSKNAILTVDGGKISSHCTDGLWGGIRVLGDPAGNQNPLDQGAVFLKNSAVIEKAKIGIHCYNSTLEEAAVPATGGGIIMANNAVFRNNLVAVQFEKYTLKSSISFFNLCNFITDYDLQPIYEPKQFIRLNEVGGLYFGGCSFTNERTKDYDIEKYGTGIYSNNSHFVVDRYIYNNLADTMKCTFKNLNYGIYALSKPGTKTFKVNHSDFKSNDCGIYALNVDNVDIKYNTFDVYEEGNSQTGLYLDACNGYVVEENGFKHNSESSGSGLTRGIIVNNSGPYNNMIYKNSFYNLNSGIVAQNKNRNKDGSFGLAIKCNNFTYTNTDIAVLKDLLPDPFSPENGIALNQGHQDTLCEAPAGNLFSNLNIVQFPDYYSIYNSCNLINYYYHKNSPNNKAYPEQVKQFIVARHPVGVNYQESCCPSNSSGGGGAGTIDEATLVYKSESDSASQSLLGLIDNGNTEEKIFDINAAAPSEALVVRDELLQISPFVSDTVLNTSINHEELFNSVMIRDILVANPQSAKSDDLMQELDSRIEPLPDYMRDEILDGIYTLSAKELLESKRDIGYRLYNYGFNRLLSASLTDTMLFQTDSLRSLYQADGSYKSLGKVAWLLLESGDTTGAIQYLTSIDNSTLTTEEGNDLNQQVAFIQWLSGNPAIDSSALEILNSFLQSESDEVSIAAKGLMVAHNLFIYHEPYLVPELFKDVEVDKPAKGNRNQRSSSIKVYPNPARNFITLVYQLEDMTSANELRIMDATGKVVWLKALTREKDQVVVNTHDFKPGAYFVQLVQKDKIVCSSKFVVIK